MPASAPEGTHRTRRSFQNQPIQQHIHRHMGHIGFKHTHRICAMDTEQGQPAFARGRARQHCRFRNGQVCHLRGAFRILYRRFHPDGAVKQICRSIHTHIVRIQRKGKVLGNRHFCKLHGVLRIIPIPQRHGQQYDLLLTVFNRRMTGQLSAPEHLSVPHDPFRQTAKRSVRPFHPLRFHRDQLHPGHRKGSGRCAFHILEAEPVHGQSGGNAAVFSLRQAFRMGIRRHIRYRQREIICMTSFLYGQSRRLHPVLTAAIQSTCGKRTARRRTVYGNRHIPAIHLRSIPGNQHVRRHIHSPSGIRGQLQPVGFFFHLSERDFRRIRRKAGHKAAVRLRRTGRGQPYLRRD